MHSTVLLFSPFDWRDNHSARVSLKLSSVSNLSNRSRLVFLNVQASSMQCKSEDVFDESVCSEDRVEENWSKLQRAVFADMSHGMTNCVGSGSYIPCHLSTTGSFVVSSCIPTEISLRAKLYFQTNKLTAFFTTKRSPLFETIDGHLRVGVFISNCRTDIVLQFQPCLVSRDRMSTFYISLFTSASPFNFSQLYWVLFNNIGDFMVGSRISWKINRVGGAFYRKPNLLDWSKAL